MKDLELSVDNTDENAFESVQIEDKFLGMGELFGEISLRDKGNISVIAQEETHLLCLNKDLYDKLYCNYCSKEYL